MGLAAIAVRVVCSSGILASGFVPSVPLSSSQSGTLRLFVRFGEYTGVCVLHEAFSAQALGSVSTWSLHPWARSLLLHRSCQNCAPWKNCCLLVYRQASSLLVPLAFNSAM